MKSTNVKIVVLPGAKVPQYATTQSAGFDLQIHSFKSLHVGDAVKEVDNSADTLVIRSGQRVLVGTGIFVELQAGTEMQIRSRSGISLKKGIVVANSPGTIDADYRGEVGLILMNTTKSALILHKGEKVAQGVVADVYQAVFDTVTELSDTSRGEGGFGSTGQ